MSLWPLKLLKLKSLKREDSVVSNASYASTLELGMEEGFLTPQLDEEEGEDEEKKNEAEAMEVEEAAEHEYYEDEDEDEEDGTEAEVEEGPSSLDSMPFKDESHHVSLYIN